MIDPDKKPLILHVVANYPDGVFQQNTTDAVKNLLEATSGSLNHFVVSISRTMNPFKEIVIHKDNIISISYFGLPAVIGQSLLMERVARRIEKELRNISLDYDMIHGHKLTVEAVLANFLSIKSSKPYATTIRGLTDGRILRWRPDRHRAYARVLQESSVVFLPAPWTSKLIKQYLEPGNAEWFDHINFSWLPNIVNFSQDKKPLTLSLKSRYVTVFRQGHGKRKGFRELLKGLVAAQRKQKHILLDVIGCGSNSIESKWTKDFGLSDQVRFLGKFDNTETVNQIAQYRGFILPTHYDTFGMVYIEALLSGVPVLYSAETGIDGYLDDFDVGVRVDPFDQASINRGILLFDERAEELGERLKLFLEADAFNFFNRTSIAAVYCKEIEKVVENVD